MPPTFGKLPLYWTSVGTEISARFGLESILAMIASCCRARGAGGDQKECARRSGDACKGANNHRGLKPAHESRTGRAENASQQRCCHHATGSCDCAIQTGSGAGMPAIHG